MRPTVVLAIGLPGAGKSTWFASNGVTPLSSDAMRRLLADDEDDQTIHVEVFEALRYLMIKRIQIGRQETYIDATNLLKVHRAPFIKLAQKLGCDVEAIYFETPLETCLERNRRRGRRVPEEIVRQMAAQLEPPTEKEGFTLVTKVTGGV